MAIGLLTEPEDIQPLPPPQTETDNYDAPKNESDVTCYFNCLIVHEAFPASEDKTEHRQAGTKKQSSYAHELSVIDLNAQRRMAHWGVVLGFLTAIGAGLLVATLLETGVASDASEKAALAAIETTEAYRRAERAWIGHLFVDYGEVGSGFIADTGETITNGFWFTVKWKNSGRTPALKTNAYIDFKVVSHDLKTPPTFKRTTAPQIMDAPIAPNVTFSTFMKAISGEDWQDIKDRKSKLAIYSIVEYCDAFDEIEQHIAEYCAFGTYAGLKTNTQTGHSFHAMDFFQIGPQQKAN